MHKLWLIFAQTATICLAALFVISTLRPELLPWDKHSSIQNNSIVTIKETASNQEATLNTMSDLNGFSKAAKIAMPSVVNVFTTKEVKVPAHPLLNDPMFRRFFGDRFEEQTKRSSSLGSVVIVRP